MLGDFVHVVSVDVCQIMDLSGRPAWIAQDADVRRPDIDTIIRPIMRLTRQMLRGVEPRSSIIEVSEVTPDGQLAMAIYIAVEPSARSREDLVQCVSDIRRYVDDSTATIRMVHDISDGNLASIHIRDGARLSSDHRLGIVTAPQPAAAIARSWVGSLGGTTPRQVDLRIGLGDLGTASVQVRSLGSVRQFDESQDPIIDAVSVDFVSNRQMHASVYFEGRMRPHEILSYHPELRDRLLEAHRAYSIIRISWVPGWRQKNGQRIQSGGQIVAIDPHDVQPDFFPI